VPLDVEGRRDTAGWVGDRPLAMSEIPSLHQVVSVSPEFLAAFQVPLVEGRTLDTTQPGEAMADAAAVAGGAEARRARIEPQPAAAPSSPR